MRGAVYADGGMVALTHALVCAAVAALLLAAIAHGARPHMLLAGTVGRAWQWWLIHRPLWLPDKPSGGCTFCTAFWVPGVPVAVAAALTGAAWWALAVPFMVAVLAAKLIGK